MCCFTSTHVVSGTPLQLQPTPPHAPQPPSGTNSPSLLFSPCPHTGSGYLTAAMAKLVGPSGFVLGVEKVPELAARSVASISASNPELPLLASSVAGVGGWGQVHEGRPDAGAADGQCVAAPEGAEGEVAVGGEECQQAGVRIVAGNALLEGVLRGTRCSGLYTFAVASAQGCCCIRTGLAGPFIRMPALQRP